MSQVLKSGQIIKTLANKKCVVGPLLGSGTQGEVYKANIEGHDYALKWYCKQFASEKQKQSLSNLINISAPDKRFLWPIDLAISSSGPGFGYVMNLRDPKYKDIQKILSRKITSSIKALITGCIYLSDSFSELHTKGLSYRDISWGNVFFEPLNGDILICDNDNVTISGTWDGGILGTPRFMAPEIVRGEAYPDRNSDLFSLAILMFYLLFNHHPLEGKREIDIHCLDLPAMKKLYGTHPLFIFDPNDKSNYPVKGIQDNPLIYWKIYPTELKDLFLKSFTEGLNNPAGRLPESLWRKELSQIREHIILCTCEAENFYDVSKLQSNGKVGQCWNCKRDLQLPPRIKIGNRSQNNNIILLNYDTKLFAHHIDNCARISFDNPIAEVTQNKLDPGVWGLKNLSRDKWVVYSVKGSTF
jgi:serine/threonine protein kinase